MSENEDTKAISLLRADPSMLKTTVTEEELEYRKTEFGGEEKLLKKQRIECTSCAVNIKDQIISGKKIFIHPSLEVLLCKDCKDFYGDGNFSVDEDGSDKYCRWCGQGGNLYCCSHCSVAICSKCVKRNFPKSYIRVIQSDDWRCFVCDTKPIWPHRALCSAAKQYIENLQKKKKPSKVVSTSETEESISRVTRPKRNRVTTSEATSESEDTAASPVKRSKKKLVISSEEESEIEQKAKNTKKPVLASSSDEKTNEENASKPGRSRSSTDVSSPSSPASKQKFMEHVITDTLNDYEKLIKIMMKSKANYIEKYVKNKRYLRNVQNLAILRDKLLELLKHSKEGVQCLERNCLSSLKCFDLIPSEKSGNESIEPDTEESVCSQDKTELINDSKLEDDLDSPAKLNSEVTPASFSTPEKKINGVEDASVGVVATSDISTSVVEAKDTPDDSDQNSISRPPVSTESAFANKETDNESILSCQNESIRESNVETEKSSKLNSTEGAEGESNVDLKVLPEVSRDDAVVSDSENSIQEKGDASNLKAEESAEDGSLPNKNKAAKMAMLQFSSDGNSSSSGKEDAKSSESDMSGIGPLKPDAEEAKSKKKKKRRELNEAKKLFLQNSASSDQDSDIERLTNLRNLRRRKKLNNSKRSSESDTVPEVEKKESAKKSEESDRKSSLFGNKEDKSWAMDYVVSSSVSDNETGTNEVSFSDFINSSDRKQKELSLKKDEISKKILLNSASDEDKSNSDSDQLLDITDLLKKPEKKKKQSQRQLNGSKPSNEVSAEEKDDDSGNISKKVKAKWRNDKLLRGKLSESDTNDDEKIIIKNKKRLEKETNNEKNNSDSSDSGDIFRPLKKIHSTWKKRRVASSSETEAGLKNSNSDSVEVISDDSDKPKKKLKKRKRIKNTMDDSDESEENPANASQNPGSASKGRKNIRKVLKDEELAEQTRKTAKEEEKRKKRIAERQALFNKSFQIKDTSDQTITKLVLDFDEETKEELISVHPELLKKLKPHQVQGVKFMWDSCFESIKQIEKGVGGGCILAHCMGLGKTLQVITLIHTLLRHEVTKVKTVLVICPLSTVLNWIGEFEVWLKDIEDCEDINIYELTKYKNNVLRADCLKHWHKEGGIMVMGYDMFRSLVMAKKTKEKIKKQIHNALLDPGPDLVICDEGHMLKNEKTAISKATMQIKSLRRIVLTGTPLQNNLIEYHCMMQFVKPNLLGDKKEFQNRFVHPITNGQYVDSTQKDVKLMKRRAHVLHKMLDGIVQRFDYKVLTPFLPPKHEFVISVALSDLQAKLYEFYINHKSQIVNVGNTTLFKDYQIMRLIWTHPLAMKLNDDRKQKALEKQDYDDDSEGSLRDFVVSGTDEETSKSDSDNSCKSIISVSSGGNAKKNGKRKGRLTRAQRKETGIKLRETENEPEYESVNHWWHEFVSNDDIEDYKQGPKLVLLFAILRQCELIGDKVLIFSQSIPSLDMIEYFLQKTEEFSQRVVGEDSLCPDDDLADYIGTWQKNIDYFRLDGQTPNDLRSKYCKIFNRPDNLRARLFLISTRAGGLGINLTAANRVIIFDASWNPSYDIQSIFRVYRFGQNKPCYIYRFLSQGTMEEKIYERQVTKLSISCRVVDEQQIDRHFSRNEVAELYNFNRKMPSSDETPKLPSDRLMAELLKEYKDIILSYHEHDSLLENIVDEDLTEEEKKQAWSDYENEKNHPPSSLASRMDGMPAYPNSYRNINNEAIMKALKTEHPTANPQQLMTMFNMVRNKLEKYYQEQMLIQQMGMVPPMNIQQPPVNVPPNMSAASPQELQEQIQMRKAAFLHQLQAQAAIRQQQQQDVNTGFYGSERDLSTPQKADQPSTSKGYSPMSMYSSPKKTTPSSSPFSTPKKLNGSVYDSIFSPNSSPNFSSLNVDSMSPLRNNDPLKVPSTWTFHWDEPDEKDVNDLQTLITEKMKSWSSKFEIIGKNVLMHLPFCVRRDTIEKKLSPYLSRLRFKRVQPDISVEDALDVIVKSLKL